MGCGKSWELNKEPHYNKSMQEVIIIVVAVLVAPFISVWIMLN